MRLASIFRSRVPFRAFWIFIAALACASSARAETAGVPPPRPERDAGPPPLPRAPEHGRRPVELVSEVGVALPTCWGDVFLERCTMLDPAVGATLVALHRPSPFFAFGVGASYSRAGADGEDGSNGSELFNAGAWGRVYFHEEGAFDPYLELELGYVSLRTTFVEVSGAQRVDSVFGPSARVGGGIDLSVLPSLRLGGSVGFSYLMLGRGTECVSASCPPSFAMTGALGAGLRATVLLGNEL